MFMVDILRTNSNVLLVMMARMFRWYVDLENNGDNYYFMSSSYRLCTLCVDLTITVIKSLFTISCFSFICPDLLEYDLSNLPTHLHL